MLLHESQLSKQLISKLKVSAHVKTVGVKTGISISAVNLSIGEVVMAYTHRKINILKQFKAHTQTVGCSKIRFCSGRWELALNKNNTYTLLKVSRPPAVGRKMPPDKRAATHGDRLDILLKIQY